MKNLKTYIFGLFAVISLSVQAQEDLSLSKATELLHTGNQKLLSTKKQAEAAQISAEAMKGLHWPSLTLNASYVRMNDNLYLDFNKYRNGLANFLELPPNLFGDWRYSFQDKNITKVSADFKWPIFTGGKINAGVKAEKLKADLAEKEIDAVENELMKTLIQRYFQTQLAQEAIKVRQQALDAAKEHLYNAQKFEENGMIAPVETMQAQTAVADAERELMGAEKDYELAKSALFGVMNVEEKEINLSTPLFNLNNLESLEYYQDLAKTNYPKIVQAKIKKQLAEQKISAEKSNYVPDIAIVGKKYLYTENLPILEPNWYVGVGMSVNIFNGFQTKKKYQEAIAISESVDMFTAQAERDIQTLVKKLYTEIQKQQEQVISLDKSISFTEELVRVREKAFANGFGTSTDVADANLYSAAIKIKKLQALYEIDKTLAELLETCGISNSYLNFTL